MYARNVVLALALTAAAAPALAYPTQSNHVYARADASLSTVDASGAFSFGDIFKAIGNFFGFKREEMDILMARAESEGLLARAVPVDESGAFNFGDILKTIGGFFGFKREEIEALARRAEEDSGAFAFSTIGQLLGGLGLGTTTAGPPYRSQFVARQAPADLESGAFSFGDIFKAIGGFFGFKREELDILMARAESEGLLARALPVDESGAFNFGDILKTIGGFFGFKREEIEALARRAEEDSGAFAFSTIGQLLGGLGFGTTTAGPPYRSQFVARQTPTDLQSGAFSFGDILKTIGGFFGFKREEMDILMARAESEGLLARSLPVDESGAFNFGDILKTIGGFFGFKREELEELARRADLESGAFSVGDIFSKIGQFLGFKREEIQMFARRELEARQFNSPPFVNPQRFGGARPGFRRPLRGGAGVRPIKVNRPGPGVRPITRPTASVQARRSLNELD